MQKAVRSLEITNRDILWEDSSWKLDALPLNPTLTGGQNDGQGGGAAATASER